MISSHTFVESDRTIDGIYVRIVEPRNGPVRSAPLLMIHGDSHGWWAFEDWLPVFAKSGRSASAMSLRNHTGSYAVPDDEYCRLTVKDYVDDVLAVIDRLSSPPVLIGHSMGGIVAQKAAEQTEPAALVLVSSVGPGQLGAMRGPMPTDKPFLPDRESVRKYWFHDISEDRLRAVYGRLVPESPSVMNDYSLGSLIVDRDAIACPVLVVSGEHDRSAVHKPQDLARFYNAELFMVPGCGHDLMLEPGGLKAAEHIDLRLGQLVA